MNTRVPPDASLDGNANVPTRAPWSAPHITIIHAGEAEFGANTSSSDGPYGGS